MWFIDILALLLLLTFFFLRSLEVVELYCVQWWWFLVHFMLLSAAWRVRKLRGAALFLLVGLWKTHVDVEPFTDARFAPLLTKSTHAGSVVVITGASSGIGLALARDLTLLNMTLVLGCRSVSKCHSVKPAGDVHCFRLDVADLTSVAEFAQQVRQRFRRVDYLINNAGMVSGKGGRTKQGLELHLGAMHVGHFLLVRELWPALQSKHPEGLPARIVNHASAAMMGGHFDESLFIGDGEGDLRGEKTDGCVSGLSDIMDRKQGICPVVGPYSRAKLAQVLFTLELQARADGSSIATTRPVKTVSLHPGSVASGIVTVTDWLVRPTLMGARVLEYCMFSQLPGGAYVDGMLGPHDLSFPTDSLLRQQGRAAGYLWSMPIATYQIAIKGNQGLYRRRLWEVTDHLVEPFANTNWTF